MAATSGVEMKFNNGTSKWSKTLKNLNYEKMGQASAAALATSYGKIVDGELEAAKLITYEDVDID